MKDGSLLVNLKLMVISQRKDIDKYEDNEPGLITVYQRPSICEVSYVYEKVLLAEKELFDDDIDIRGKE